MDYSPLVDEQIDDGRRFIERFAADGCPVRAAFWVKTAEDGFWFLYVVTDLVDAIGPTDTYRLMRDSLETLRPPVALWSMVKVVGPGHPVARDALAVAPGHAGRATRLGDLTLGGVDFGQVYIYPPHVFMFGQPDPMTTEDVGREIVRLMSRGAGGTLPSRVTLRDGSSFHGVPFALQVGGQKAVEAQFIADREATPRVVRLDEIASIL